MPHLAVMRKGWENEHLAAFLLSQIAFVANPLTVADDIGSDFLCTLFQAEEQNDTQVLYPLNSFAIQVKSNPGIVDAIKVIGYLEQLELPYFLGVMDRSKLSLSLYSGEYLPMMFSEHGKPQSLKLPFVAAIAARDNTDTVSQNAQRVAQLCSRMHANISTWKLDEYVFRLPADQVQIMAGSGSAKTFRRNFYWRLTEVFRNLKWLRQQRAIQFDLAEFKMFEQIYVDLAKGGCDIPRMVTDSYQDLKGLVDNKIHP